MFSGLTQDYHQQAGQHQSGASSLNSKRDAEAEGGGGQCMTIAVPSNAGPRGGSWLAPELQRSPLSQGFHLSLAPVLYDQFAQLRALCLVTEVVSILSHSCLWLSHLTQLGKKANLVQKGGRSWESVFLCSCIPVQSYSLPPYHLLCT